MYANILYYNKLFLLHDKIFLPRAISISCAIYYLFVNLFVNFLFVDCLIFYFIWFYQTIYRISIKILISKIHEKVALYVLTDMHKPMA